MDVENIVLLDKPRTLTAAMTIFAEHNGILWISSRLDAILSFELLLASARYLLNNKKKEAQLQ